MIAFNLLTCAIALASSDPFFEAPITLSQSYQKPKGIRALDWLQHLEDERDKADILGNFDVFKKITDEISATIGGKYGFTKRPATSQEKLVMIHSITRTRHRFKGQRHMLRDRYLGYDKAKTSAALKADSRFQVHMAAVLGIDAMAAKSLEDDDFLSAWSEISDSKPTSALFIEAVLAQAKNQEKGEIFESLNTSLIRFLQNRQSTINLANQVFNVFAPALDIAKIYGEVMVSGGTYKGWEVHGIDAFAYWVTLTPEENELHPGLQTKLRTEATKKIPTTFDEIFSTSQRGVFLPEATCSELSIAPQNITVEYIFDHCLKEHGFPVTGSGPMRFFLSRPVNAALKPILNRPYRVIPEKKLIETYKQLAAYSINVGMQKVLGFWIGNKHEVMSPLAAQGIPEVLFKYATMHFNGLHGVGRNIPKSIEYCRDAANLGSKAAIENLPNFLNNYALMFFNGTDGVQKDIAKAIDLFKEAAQLGCEQSKNNLFCASVDFLTGLFGLTKDIAAGIDLCQFLDKLGYQKAKTLLNEMINAGIVDGKRSIILAGYPIEHNDESDLIITRSYTFEGNLDHYQRMLRFYDGQVRVTRSSFFPIFTTLGARTTATTASQLISAIKGSARRELPAIDSKPDHTLCTEDQVYFYDPDSISYTTTSKFSLGQNFWSAPGIELAASHFKFNLSVFETDELFLHYWGPDETPNGGTSPLYAVTIERAEDSPGILLDGIVDFKETWEKTFSSERQFGYDLSSLEPLRGLLIAGAKKIEISVAPSKI